MVILQSPEILQYLVPVTEMVCVFVLCALCVDVLCVCVVCYVMCVVCVVCYVMCVCLCVCIHVYVHASMYGETLMDNRNEHSVCSMCICNRGGSGCRM